MSKVWVSVNPYNGNWAVWLRTSAATYMTLHATKEDAEAKANKLVEEFGYVREP